MSKKQAYIACVSAKYGSERVIRAAKCIAEDDNNARLEIVSVLSSPGDSVQMETIEYLHDIARKSGAQMTVLYGDNPALTVADYIKRSRITTVIAGEPSAENQNHNDFVKLMKAVLPKVRVLLIPPHPVNANENVTVTVGMLPLQRLSVQAKNV